MIPAKWGPTHVNIYRAGKADLHPVVTFGPENDRLKEVCGREQRLLGMQPAAFHVQPSKSDSLVSDIFRMFFSGFSPLLISLPFPVNLSVC